MTLGFKFQSPSYEMKWADGVEEVARLSTIVPSKLFSKHFKELLIGGWIFDLLVLQTAKVFVDLLHFIAEMVKLLAQCAAIF